jgi:hypothetical protein
MAAPRVSSVLVHVPSDNEQEQLPNSWREQGRPTVYHHPSTVSRYMIHAPGNPAGNISRFQGVAHA